MKWLNPSRNPIILRLPIFGAMPTASGLTIGPQAALSVPAVNAAIRVIAESVAALIPFNTCSGAIFGDVKA